MLTWIRMTTVVVLLVAFFACSISSAQQSLVGEWHAELKCPGGAIVFGLDVIESDDGYSGFFVNGSERIKIPVVSFDGKSGLIDVSHYDSRIEFKMVSAGKIEGRWTKRKGANKYSNLEFMAALKQRPFKETRDGSQYVGKWKTKFDSDSDHSVAVIKQAGENRRMAGTFLTTTGDYRYLAGYLSEDKLTLSCFDGAHAFLFHIRSDGDKKITGDFWSSDSWHDTFKGTLDPEVELPDAFNETKVADAAALGKLSFPDLDGKPTRLDDPKFAGKARIIYVFGSWCPNCHDAADYFSKLEGAYKAKGLSILGLAFEHTGDFQRDSEQVKKYLARHESNYPVLIAGLSDKAEASKSFPLLDRVRSYPTTIFLDRNNVVKAIHTGFTGPATGEAFTKQKQKFESIIEQLLKEGS